MKAKLLLIFLTVPSIALSTPTIGIIDNSFAHGNNIKHVIEKYSNGTASTPIFCDLEDYYKCLEYFSKHPVDVLNMSLQSTSNDPNPNETEERLLNEIADKGTIIVIAAGQRERTTTKNEISYPACYKSLSKKVIVVGNTSKNSKNCGTVDLVVDYVLECAKGNNCMKGTSQSTAQISGKIYAEILKTKDKRKVFNKYNKR